MKTQSGDPRAVTNFRFGSRQYDPSTGEIRLGYILDSGTEMVERLVFPFAPWPPEASRQAAFERALLILHLIAGVSYYKAVLAPKVQVDGEALDSRLADFITTLYVEGLAEFSHVNRVPVEGRFKLAGDPGQGKQAPSLLLPNRALVAIGGGKDSLVGLDLLRRSGLEVMPVCIGSSSLIGATVKTAGLPLLRISRELAPELERLNAAGAWNGHVPVTAINSAILLCAAILYGYRYIVFSNERSADEATLVTDEGKAVNHQYSKSSAFEREFRDLVHRTVSPDIEYFSILRPFSELEIVRRFSLLTSFHKVYSSCNRNFHLQGSQISGRWCGQCPKCRFAALSLAVFLTPDEVMSIQGADLLDDLEQLEGFSALCNLGRDKPFECVGEAGESRAAIAALAERPAWSEHAVVQALRPKLNRGAVPSMSDLLKPSPNHFIPGEILKALPGTFS